MRVPYICGPLAELSSKEREKAEFFYERIANLCEDVIGARAFVPHENYSPEKHPCLTSTEAYIEKRTQILTKASHLIVVPIVPFWGSDIEIKTARQGMIPIIIICRIKFEFIFFNIL